MDDIDLKQLALTTALKLACTDNKSVPRHKYGEKFLKGPIPWDWLTLAGNLSGKTLHVSAVIWFLAGMKKARTITLSNKILEDMGVNRYAAYRGLAALEKAGLISTSKHRGRCPVVTINDCPKKK